MGQSKRLYVRSRKMIVLAGRKCCTRLGGVLSESEVITLGRSESKEVGVQGCYHSSDGVVNGWEIV